MFAVGSDASFLDEIVRERRALEAREAAWLAKVAAYDRSGQWADDGYLSASSAIAHRCAMVPADAKRHVRLARGLTTLPRVAAAFAHGDITRAHAVQIVSANTPERAAAFDELEATFVEAARRMDPKALRTVVRYACDALDGGSPDARTPSSLHMSVSIDQRVFLDANLHADDGEIVMTAINAEADRKGHGPDRRSAAQRRADALVAICRRAIDRGEVGDGRRVLPYILAVADVERITGDATLISDARAEATYTGTLSNATLERLLCDCKISRVLTAGTSEILDFGRATRIVPPKLWAALVARDRGCVTPGCGAPPAQCEAHHKTPWQHGGETNITNTELRCWHCHDHIHRDTS
jgi:hypothetical protein